MHISWSRYSESSKSARIVWRNTENWVGMGRVFLGGYIGSGLSGFLTPIRVEIFGYRHWFGGGSAWSGFPGFISWAALYYLKPEIELVNQIILAMRERERWAEALLA